MKYTLFILYAKKKMLRTTRLIKLKKIGIYKTLNSIKLQPTKFSKLIVIKLKNVIIIIILGDIVRYVHIRIVTVNRYTQSVFK